MPPPTPRGRGSFFILSRALFPCAGDNQSMSSEQPNGVMTLQLSGEQGLHAFNEFIEEAGFNDSIQSIEIRVEAETPIELTEYITGASVEPRTNGGKDEAVNFNEGSRTRKLATFLYQNDGDQWHTTNEIKDALPEECEIDPDDVSQILWELSERGVVEKQQHEGDKRKKEYRLNDLGLRSMEKLAA